jgi:hypothetical protein
VADEVQPPTRPLAFGADARVGQPDRRHQIAARQLGEHPGVDPFGLASERRESFYFLRVGNVDLPPGQLEPVVHEAGAVHRLDRGANRRAVPSETFGQSIEAVCIRRRSTNLERRTFTPKQVEVDTLAAQIHSGVQHCNGAPFVFRGRAEDHSAGGPSSWHSLPWRSGTLNEWQDRVWVKVHPLRDGGWATDIAHALSGEGV